MTTTSLLGRTVVAFIGIVTAFVMVGGTAVLPANGQLTNTQIQSILGLLQSFGADQATINNVNAALTGQPTTGGSGSGTSGTACYNFTRSLHMDMSPKTGADVTALQNFLTATGHYTYSGGATGYFGAITKTAVSAWQGANGVSPTAGYFGPASQAKYNTMCGGTTGGGSGTVIPSGTDLKVSLSPDSPAQAAVIQGQALADLGHYTFTNTSATEAVVTKVTLNRTGISGDSTLSNVYLFNGASRLTGAATVSSGVISFNNLAGVFKVPARSAVTLSVQSDIAGSTAGQIIGVALASVDSNVPATGAFPIAANFQSIAAASLGTVALTYTGPSNATENPATEVRVFEASTVVSTHKARLESVTFENRGTTKDGDLTNLKLYIDGVQIGSTVASFVNDRATFDLRSNPVLLDTGTRIVKVLADVVGGSSFTYDVQIRRTSDLRVVDNELNQPILSTDAGGAYPVSASTANTIAAGTLSVTKATTSPSSNISVGATNVLWATFEFRAAGEDIKIEALNASSTGQTMDNVKIFVDGSQVGSTNDISSIGTATEFALGSSFIAKAGKVMKVEIYGDAKTSAAVNYANASTNQVAVTVLAADTEGLNSGNTVTAVTNITGNSRTISSSSLTATKSTGYGNQTMIAGTNNAKLGSFVLSAGATEGINVNTIVVNLPTADAASLSDLKLCNVGSDCLGSNQIGSTKPSPSTDNSFSVNIDIPTSGTKTIDILGNIKSGANAGTMVATIDATTGGRGAVTATSATVGTDLDLQTITVGSGTLTVAVNNGATPNSFIAIAGTNDVKVGSFRFTAQNSAFTVNELKIKVPTDAATGVGSVKLKWSNGGVDASKTLTAPVDGSAQTYATSTFTGLGYVVPQNGNADLDVYVSLSTIDSRSTNITGKAISVLIDWNEGFSAKDSGGTEDTTAHASADLNSAATSGKGTAYLRGSVPTLSSTPITGTLTAGSNKSIGNVTITADSAGDIGWKKLSFTVSKTAALTTGATTTLALWDGSTEVDGTFGTTTGALVGGLDSLVNITSGNITFVATSEQEIAAGTSKTYVLKTTIGAMASGVANDTIDVSIVNTATAVTTGTATAVGDDMATTESLTWSDRSSISTVHSESTSDWTNDYLVKTLPLTVGSLSD